MNRPELEDNFDLIELLNKDEQVEINISQKSEHNINSKDEENSKKRNDSCNYKEINDFVDCFWKGKSLFDFLFQNNEFGKQINKELSYLLKEIFQKRINYIQIMCVLCLNILPILKIK